MGNLDSQPTSLTLPPATDSTLEPARWLIVLVPCLEADPMPATRTIWELANASGRRVRFIGLYENAAQELSLRRQLAGMSAMVGVGGIYTETETVFSQDYVEVVRSRWQPGDLVVCFREQRTGRLSRPLSDVLQSSLNVPVYVLSGLYPQKNMRVNWLTQVFAWSGSIGLIAGFFLIQVRVDQVATGWIQLAMILMSISLEIWMIWAWNNLFA
jgi:hypothetical protein